MTRFTALRNNIALAGAGLALAAFGAATQAHAATTSVDDPAAAVLQLVRQHAQAQSSFDQAALQTLTADNYIEISPVGELDTREKMLGFYAQDKMRPAPAVAVEEAVTRLLGDSAIVVAKLAYTMTLDGNSRNFAMRASFVAHKTNGAWKLVSAHYTGIRPPKPAGS